VKIVNVAQNSDEWLDARAGLVTASAAKVLVTPTFKVSKSEGVETYLAQLVAEWWVGTTFETFDSAAMEAGRILEEKAKPTYRMETGEDARDVGFITDDSGLIGCSPDLLVTGSHGVEIKCPMAKTHVGWLLDGLLPPEHSLQVQFSIYVTGLPFWKFMSYRRMFPPLILRVDRDEKAQAAIKDALEIFLPKLEAAKAKLLAMNGGVRLPRIVRPSDLPPETDNKQGITP
jgi:hypothetical protein